METTGLAKQMIAFQKSVFDNTYQTAVMLQDHSEKMARTAIEQAAWIPEESRRLLHQWTETFRNSRDQWKTSVDDHFSKMTEMVLPTTE